MNAAGPLIQAHIFCKNKGHESFVVEGMSRLEVFKIPSLDFQKGFPESDARFLLNLSNKTLCNQVNLTIVGSFHKDVIQTGMHGDGHARRQGPGSRRPDGDIHRFTGNHREAVFLVNKRIGHVNRRRGLVLIFDFRRGQCCLTVNAPENRFLSFIDKSPLHHVGESTDLRRLVLGLERHIRIFPVSQYTKSFEFVSLHVDIGFGIFHAVIPEFRRLNGFLVLTAFPEDPELYGQSMSIPARDIGCTISPHPFIFWYEILENLVEGRSDMNIPVGIGRAVVEYEGFLVLSGFHEGLVKLHGIPELQPLRLLPGKIGPHGKGCLWKVQRFFIIVRHYANILPSVCSGAASRRRLRQKSRTLPGLPALYGYQPLQKAVSCVFLAFIVCIKCIVASTARPMTSEVNPGTRSVNAPPRASILCQPAILTL